MGARNGGEAGGGGEERRRRREGRKAGGGQSRETGSREGAGVRARLVLGRELVVFFQTLRRFIRRHSRTP